MINSHKAVQVKEQAPVTDMLLAGQRSIIGRAVTSLERAHDSDIIVFNRWAAAFTLQSDAFFGIRVAKCGN